MNMLHVLFIFEEIPEKTYVFSMDVDEKTYKRLLKANETHINGDATKQQLAIILKFFFNDDYSYKSFVTEQNVDLDRKMDAMIRLGITM
jgi:hypothetical protein